MPNSMYDFEKASLNSFMFCYPNTLLTRFFFHFRQLYGPTFRVVGNTHNTEITKQRDQSLRRLRLLHLLKQIMLFERTKYRKNIYASMVLNNNSENF
ncbi:hypothetical protein HZS_7752 [Henneguya salminicola]|nr:hypothetical protein HZS_7752 [Henneguya salminicola]